jgi:peptidoglycan/xylan/chitin deacetylase (PgdA/CDA1 family)
MERRVNALLTVDLEQDCPPYLDTWRGAEVGAPLLLDFLRREGIPTTCFCTGGFARRYPALVRRVVGDGHELGCHGDTHRSLMRMSRDQARGEIGSATAALRPFFPVVSFRAPYLQMPDRFLPVLAEHGYTIDSSIGRHKVWPARVELDGPVARVPVSVTSSTLRWPAGPRNVLLGCLRDPIVLFVHPWEFVDLRRERLRFDCRFKTGAAAFDCLGQTIHALQRRGVTFTTLHRFVVDARSA